MQILFILNDAPYGSEKSYNALRLAMTLQKDQPGTEVRLFLMADAVTATLRTQKTPEGYYNIERMLKSLILKGAKIKLCGSCCDARGLLELPTPEGVVIGTMTDLAQWVVESDKVLVF